MQEKNNKSIDTGKGEQSLVFQKISPCYDF